MRFSKWHGLGNDYLLVQRAELPGPLTAEQVRRLCDYHFGVGSDGVLEVVSANGNEAEVVIWNPDGSTAELSGNGTRIAARWLARRSGVETVRIRVGPREVVARMRGGLDVEMDVGGVEVGEPETLALDGETVEFTPASVGNPHAVVRREPDRASLLRLGPLIETHPRFPDRTNVQLVRVDGAGDRREPDRASLLRLGPLIETHPRFPDRTNVQLVRVDGPGDLTVAVWERGAGETLSSGTSAVATAGVAVARGWCESPVTVHLAGGDLLVELDDGMRARLTGPAQEIFRGEASEELGL